MTSAADTFSLAALEIFCACAQSASFACAARTLGLTQSAVSQTITRLEEQLGFTLFDRQARPVQLTARGREFAALARGLTEQARLVAEAARKLRTEGNALAVRFGITEVAQSFAGADIEAALIPMTAAFEAHTGLIPKILTDFSEDRLDLAVAPDIAEKDRLISCDLLRETYLFVLPKAAGLTADNCPTEVLRKHLGLPFVSYGPQSQDWQKALKTLRILEIPCADTIYLENTRAVTEAVVNGLGWTILPPMNLWPVRDRLDAVTVHPVRPVSADKTLRVAARSLRCAELMEKTAGVFRQRFTEHYRPELTRLKPALAGFLELLS